MKFYLKVAGAALATGFAVGVGMFAAIYTMWS